ncbi:hypothetical protein ACI2LF_12450 [Kribbella sp. NPDC020789]
MQLRRLGLGRNPLRRGTDRLEALMLWCGLVVGLLLIPFAAGIGTAVRDSGAASAAQQRAVLQEVHARTLEATDRAVPSAPGDLLSPVRVGYVDAAGFSREMTAPVAIGTARDTEVTIWLNASGAAVAEPRTAGDNALLGAWAGIFSLLALWLLLWGLLRLLRVPLDRRRSQLWDDSWREVAPRWIRGQK